MDAPGAGSFFWFAPGSRPSASSAGLGPPPTASVRSSPVGPGEPAAASSPRRPESAFASSGCCRTLASLHGLGPLSPATGSGRATSRGLTLSRACQVTRSSRRATATRLVQASSLEIEMDHEGVEMTGEPWNPEAARNPDEDPSGTDQPMDRRDVPGTRDDPDEVPIDDQPAAELPAAESDQGRHGQFDGASG